MFFFHIAVFAALITVIAYKEKEELVDAVPVAVCILVLILYGLSFVNGLAWSDYPAIAGFLAVIVTLIRETGEQRKNIASFCLGELKKPGSIIALFMMIAVPLLVSGKTVTWWDDYNFWATDVKSIFYLNGFAQKYQNAAPEFGDYPPGTQMMKWWFAHFYPSEFKEGLMFAGYYFMNLAFLLPLFRFVKKRNIPVMILAAAALWLFPTCAEVFWCDGCCADYTMAVIYGAFLAAVVDRKGHSRLFYYGRQTLFLMVLVLCKNVAPMWAAFALLFAYGYHFFILKKEEKTKADLRWLFWETLLPVLTEGTWLLFCLLNRRVAKLTGTALHMASGSMNVPDVQQEMVNAFFTAFVSYPLHRWSTAAVDLTPFALFLLILLFVFLLYKRGKIRKKQGWFFGIFAAVSGLCFYGINLISHLTIFAAETQYLDPFGMVSSIERYGAPFTVGSLYLLAHLSMSREKENGKEEGKQKENAVKRWVRNFPAGLFFCLVFVFLTADYQSAYRALAGYRSAAAESLKEREDILDEAAETFLLKVGAGKFGSCGRVLYLRDISDISWVRNAYINFEAAPVSVMYGNVDGADMSAEAVWKAAEDAHAGYLYADEIAGGKELLDKLVKDGEFEFGCLYEIEEKEGTPVLVRTSLNRNSIY